MTDQHRSERASGIPRLLLLLALLTGVVAMHAGVFLLQPHTAHASTGDIPTSPQHSWDGSVVDGSAVTAIAAPDAGSNNAARSAHSDSVSPTSTGLLAHPSDIPPTGSPAPIGSPHSTAALPHSTSAEQGPDCDSGGCGAHGGIHLCVFILSVIALGLGLVLLFRLADNPLSAVAKARRLDRRQERPPPWTVLSLSELAILRI
ncbi:hypothetical protein B0T36_00825 [Nocardia donostiensis]|uniref:hypothetical protein n=1 Tax=Nocardia donostiensis TaxID=1538463 RepID=UPI0009D9CDF4|nr:hypothetical protein [Nocardia donostiensis]OQS17188.1 hypothetical protein B0T36_00825 [Nocardia donostiensis]